MEIYGMTGERLGLIGSLHPHPSNPSDPDKPSSPPHVPGPSVSPFGLPSQAMQPPPTKKFKLDNDHDASKSKMDQIESKGMPREEIEERMGGMEKWKMDFVKKPSLSVRKGIAWGYSSPYEDTSTLVLTAPSSRFVDVRFPLQSEPKQSLSSHPSFWAFTGVASTSFLEADPNSSPDATGVSMPYAAHCVWKHDIDSKGPNITDEGDMFILENGDCMEIGLMEKPGKAGKLEMYKEYWTSPKAKDGSEVDKRPCVVAETVHNDISNSNNETETQVKKGLIIRIGNHCQGIAQVVKPNGDEIIFVERWCKAPKEQKMAVEHIVSQEADDNNKNDHSDPSNWCKDWRSNTDTEEHDDVVIPCMWVCGDGRAEGNETVARGVKWKISEAYE